MKVPNAFLVRGLEFIAMSLFTKICRLEISRKLLDGVPALGEKIGVWLFLLPITSIETSLLSCRDEAYFLYVTATYFNPF